MSEEYRRVDSAEELELQARKLKSIPVLSITDLGEGAERLADQQLSAYLSDQKLNWLIPLSNGDILFNHQRLSTAFQTLAKVQNPVRRAIEKRADGKKVGKLILRPTAGSVIEFLSDQFGKQEGSTNKRRVRSATLYREETDQRTQVQRRLDALVAAALEAKASDIHIETDKEANIAKIKFRIDGVLITQQSGFLVWTEVEALEMGAMIIDNETQSGSGSAKESFDESKPIDGGLEVNVDGAHVKLRYSHLPSTAPRGLTIVMRATTGDNEGNIPSLEELNYEPDEIAMLERAFRYPHGIVIFSGPTGSGKSSAMAAGVITLPKGLKIISFEDPVETNLPNVIQVQVGSQEETSYAGYARAVLRQDPDVIIYGEIRDEEVARHAGHQANTGHLVLSTLHTNSAPEAIPRLADLGFTWNELAGPSLIRVIVAQRLVRKLCQHCAVPLSSIGTKGWSNEDLIRVRNFFEEIHPEKFASIRTINRSSTNQCKHCKGSGERGRMPITEIIMLDDEGRRYIKKQDISGWIDYLYSQGWESMMDKAVRRILRGELCPVSVERVLESPFGIRTDTFNYGAFTQQLEEIRNTRRKMTFETQKNYVEDGA